MWDGEENPCFPDLNLDHTKSFFTATKIGRISYLILNSSTLKSCCLQLCIYMSFIFGGVFISDMTPEDSKAVGIMFNLLLAYYKLINPDDDD